MTEDRSIWHFINRAIADTIPCPIRRHLTELDYMSSASLRKYASKILYLDQRWRYYASGRANIPGISGPRRVESYVISQPVYATCVRMLPGGDHVLVLLSDGTLQLRALANPMPLATVQGPTYKVEPDCLKLDLYTSRDELIAVVTMLKSTVDGQYVLYVSSPIVSH